jgi:two-component system, OmpR family, response regulator BaeR
MTNHPAPTISAVAPVLVVEDDPKIALLLLDYLRAEGLPAHGVADGQAALALITASRPSVVLLDLMLPGLDGIALCRAVRTFSDVPIIMLTARVDELDRLLGLETGADDYVCKPFSPREVMARVKVQLRRVHSKQASGPALWAIDDEKLVILWRGQTLALTVLEFRMFRLLLKHPGRVFSRAQILDSVRPDDHQVSDRVIDSHVKNLRRKIQLIDPLFNCLTSVYGVGYCFDEP